LEKEREISGRFTRSLGYREKEKVQNTHDHGRGNNFYERKQEQKLKKGQKGGLTKLGRKRTTVIITGGTVPKFTFAVRNLLGTKGENR